MGMTEYTQSTLDYGVMIMGIAGGLALFLFGMRNLTDSLKTVAGDRMKQVLGKLTTNRFNGLLAGTFITAVIQSSSITTVLLVGFVSAGLMTLEQSVGVILGADIGTTITAQIIAFKVTRYALAIIAAGFLLELVSKKPLFKHYGSMIVGLGLLFLGMDFMSEATNPLRSYTPFMEMVQGMHHPIYGIIVGAVFTALVQSSSATTGIVIVLAAQGLIPLEAGIALVFGANIGTCVTALLSSIGKPTEAVQTALAHILFKVIGVLLWVLFIPQFADLIRNISPSADHLEGVARMAAESPRQIANAHTVFNVGNALIFIWFAPWIGRLAATIVPKKRRPDSTAFRAKHLNLYYLQSPAAAVDQVRLELKHLGTLVLDMVKAGLPAAIKGSKVDLDSLKEKDNDVDALHGQILAFLSSLSTGDLGKGQSRAVLRCIAIANYVENIGDIIETDIARDGYERIEKNLSISVDTADRLEKLYTQSCHAVETVVELIGNPDLKRLHRFLEGKEAFEQQVQGFRAHLANRMSSGEPNRIETFRLESNLVEYTNRIYILARRTAKTIMELSQARIES
jgi:phosphate:Na+ symporter